MQHAIYFGMRNTSTIPTIPTAPTTTVQPKSAAAQAASSHLAAARAALSQIKTTGQRALVEASVTASQGKLADLLVRLASKQAGGTPVQTRELVTALATHFRDLSTATGSTLIDGLEEAQMAIGEIKALIKGGR